MLPSSVNHRLPSDPAVIWLGRADGAIGNVRRTPDGVRRPMVRWAFANQRLPSAPTTMEYGLSISKPMFSTVPTGEAADASASRAPVDPSATGATGPIEARDAAGPMRIGAIADARRDQSQRHDQGRCRDHGGPDPGHASTATTSHDHPTPERVDHHGANQPTASAIRCGLAQVVVEVHRYRRAPTRPW